jgi:hypothetical protein
MTNSPDRGLAVGRVFHAPAYAVCSVSTLPGILYRVAGLKVSSQNKQSR